MAKKKIDLFGDDPLLSKPKNEFEALLNTTTVSARGLVPGDRFRGEILAVHGMEAFVSTGTPVDATLPLSAGKEPPKPGDFLDVLVVRVREGEILVKRPDERGTSADTDSLEDAFDMEIPVEGVVLEEVKGGFRINVQGQKGFCPISQIDWRCVTPADYIGKKYEFIITKFERGRDLVVSRRKVLELQRAEGEGEFLNTAQVGDIHTGTIFRIEKYGAFVRLENGMEGLIPISELAFGRLGHPQEVVNLEQVVQVKLIRMIEEESRLKLSFSLKQGGSVQDPWDGIESGYPVGSHHDGYVEHKEPFGIFVKIGNGVTGLLPRSAWRDSPEGSKYENKRKGDQVKVRVDRIDTDGRKISLSLPGEDDDQSWREHKAQKASMGTLGDLLKGLKVNK